MIDGLPIFFRPLLTVKLRDGVCRFLHQRQKRKQPKNIF